ncbi:MAG: MerR family transcriptional regulator [Actinomycetota bacterium]|nr:MerR family transcriptional regulator [Actinomycetota bacterium]
MPEYRVDALAEAAGLTVEVVRSYQSKGLLPPPRHRGRVALYDAGHLERLATIRDLKARGHSLRAIASMLTRELSGELADGPAGRRYREAVLGPQPEHLTFAQVAEQARVPPSLLRSLEASGLIRPIQVGDERRYTADDVRAVRMLLRLVGGGVPLEEFMGLARTQLDAATTVAEGAVELFLRYVRQPLLESDLTPEQEADRLVTAIRHMVQAATGLISYNVQRMMLNLVEEEIERQGTGAEREALHREVAGGRAGTQQRA